MRTDCFVAHACKLYVMITIFAYLVVKVRRSRRLLDKIDEITHSDANQC